MVSNLFRNEGLNVVLNMKNLALIPEKNAADPPDKGQEEMMKTR
jgi:hypothetical protein